MLVGSFASLLYKNRSGRVVLSLKDLANGIGTLPTPSFVVHSRKWMDPKIADVRCAQSEFGLVLTELGLVECRSSHPRAIASYSLAL